MNICQVITRLIIGGAQENTLLTCRGLVERGHKVTLACGPETGPEGSLWEEASGCGCEIVTIRPLRRAVRPADDWRAFRDLRVLFRRLNPDVVHTHSSKAGILGRFAAASAGVPIIVHTIHGMSFNRTQPRPVQWFYRRLERAAAKKTTRFISVADAMTDQAVRAGLARRDRFVTIRSGMETDVYRPSPDDRRAARTEWGVQDSDIVIGTVARLFQNKGYEDILAAMSAVLARCPAAKFVWIGDGPHRKRYESALDIIGARNRVVLTGLLHPSKVAALLNGFDVLVHASRWEGLPRAVAQALLTGVPAVCFDNDGAPEVVSTGETGILVPIGNAPVLADAIISLASDAELRRRMGQAGRERCVKIFDCRNMVDKICAEYDRHAKHRP